ncbi:MAG: hypothetical protein JSS53_08860 [Proteobacteria bacterium]|nr:hypothetical protein [Pseudomonadota bacterium]
MKKLITSSALLLLTGFSLAAHADVNLRAVNKTDKDVFLGISYSDTEATGRSVALVAAKNASLTKALVGKKIVIESAVAALDNGTFLYCGKSPGFISIGHPQAVFTVTENECIISNA